MRITVLSVSFCLIAAGICGATAPSGPAVERRADIIRIDNMKTFGALERPPVLFLHQKHTEALAEKNKDCTACHLVENKRLVPKYMRLENTTRQAVMDIYHVNCLACHQETADAGQKSGPLVCGECHKDRPDLVSIWQSIGMDKSLHYRHVKAQNEKCERCHHQYNEVMSREKKGPVAIAIRTGPKKTGFHCNWHRIWPALTVTIKPWRNSPMPVRLPVMAAMTPPSKS